MGTKHVVWGSLFLVALFTASAGFAVIVSGSDSAGFQSWDARDLNHNGKPYWDNKSLDGATKQQQKKNNVGYNLVDESPIPLDDAPGVLPYWGKAKGKKKDGGNADLNFFFQGDVSTNAATLKLEMDPAANIDEFGWYDKSDPSVLHPVFLGADSPITNAVFTPGAQYGLYLKRADQATFYTESYLNPFKDRSHQHFVVFQESATPGAEVYWIGIENRTRLELKNKEGGLGDYNDMLIRISTASIPLPVPEPSAAFLVLSGTSLILVLLNRQRK